jgi:hypothetical protein
MDELLVHVQDQLLLNKKRERTAGTLGQICESKATKQSNAKPIPGALPRQP